MYLHQASSVEVTVLASVEGNTSDDGALWGDVQLVRLIFYPNQLLFLQVIILVYRTVSLYELAPAFSHQEAYAVHGGDMGQCIGRLLGTVIMVGVEMVFDHGLLFLLLLALSLYPGLFHSLRTFLTLLLVYRAIDQLHVSVVLRDPTRFRGLCQGVRIWRCGVVDDKGSMTV